MSNAIAPGAHLVAHFTSSHEPFEHYHAAAMELAEGARTDPSILPKVRRVVTQYLHHLHIHHTAEERELFPAIREAAPELTDAVDTLLDHHARLAELIRDVSAALTWALTAPAAAPHYIDAINALTAQLDALHHLVADHLEFEEATTIPVIRTWADWPF